MRAVVSMVALLLVGCFVASTVAFSGLAPVVSSLSLRGSGRCSRRSPGKPGIASVQMLAVVKRSPLEDEGKRGLEEEERRISLWRNKFELDNDHVGNSCAPSRFCPIGLVDCFSM